MADNKKATSGRKGAKSSRVPWQLDNARGRNTETRARGVTGRIPWAGSGVTEMEPVVTVATAAAPSAGVSCPPPGRQARTPIDRGVAPPVFTLDVPVRNPETQQVVLILRRPYGFPSGGLPGDPSLMRTLPGATVAHRAIVPMAASRAARWGRYA